MAPRGVFLYKSAGSDGLNESCLSLSIPDMLACCETQGPGRGLTPLTLPKESTPARDEASSHLLAHDKNPLAHVQTAETESH